MSRYDVIANILVMVTVDDKSERILNVHVIDPATPEYKEYMDVWRLGNRESDATMVVGEEKARVRQLLEDIEWPNVREWDQ